MSNTILLSFFFIVFLSVISTIGFSLLFYRNNLLKAFLSSPAIFFIVMSLLTANLSFIGLPVKSFSKLILIIYFATGIILIINKIKKKAFFLSKEDVKKTVLIILFGLISSLFILFPVIKYNVFNFYNDHITYIVQSEFLQSHGFFSLADVKSEQWTDNMLLYQKQMLRMGAQFFTSFIRAILPVKHTIEIYPSVLAFSQFALVFSLALLVTEINTSFIFLLIALIINFLSTSLNGFIVVSGFLPQTFGILIVIFLLSQLLSLNKNKSIDYLLLFLNLISFAALILTYQEIVPFFLISILLILFFSIYKKNSSFKKNFYICLSYLISFIVFPVSSYMLYIGLKTQIGAAVGWNEKISFINYVLMIFGQNSYQAWSSVKKALVLLPGIIISFIIFILSMSQFIKKVNKYLIICLFFLPFLFALIYFRFLVINPFDQTIGQSWSIYKIIQWTYWITILILSLGLKDFIEERKLSIKILILVLVTLIPSYIVNFRKTNYYGVLGIKKTINSNKPLEEYKKVIDNPGKYAPANLFFSGIHPSNPYMILSILKDNSKGVFLFPDNQNTYVRDENMNTPQLSQEYYQWAYYQQETAATEKKIDTVAGFDIYPRNTSIAYFKEGFGNKFVKNNNHFVWLINPKAELRILVTKNGLSTFKSDVHAIKTGKLIIYFDNKMIKSINFNNKDVFDQELMIDNLKPGFYRLKLNWVGDIDNQNILLFSNSLIINN